MLQLVGNESISNEDLDLITSKSDSGNLPEADDDGVVVLSNYVPPVDTSLKSSYTNSYTRASSPSSGSYNSYGSNGSYSAPRTPSHKRHPSGSRTNKLPFALRSPDSASSSKYNSFDNSHATPRSQSSARGSSSQFESDYAARNRPSTKSDMREEMFPYPSSGRNIPGIRPLSPESRSHTTYEYGSPPRSPLPNSQEDPYYSRPSTSQKSYELPQLPQNRTASLSSDRPSSQSTDRAHIASKLASLKAKRGFSRHGSRQGSRWAEKSSDPPDDRFQPRVSSAPLVGKRTYGVPGLSFAHIVLYYFLLFSHSQADMFYHRVRISLYHSILRFCFLSMNRHLQC